MSYCEPSEWCDGMLVASGLLGVRAFRSARKQAREVSYPVHWRTWVNESDAKNSISAARMCFRNLDPAKTHADDEALSA